MTKPHGMSRNTLKYQGINVKRRAEKRKEWNKANLTPIGLIAFFIIVFCAPLFRVYWKRENTSTIKRL